MCYLSDEIFDGGLSDERGTRDYQRRHGYHAPVKTLSELEETWPKARGLLSSPQGEAEKLGKMVARTGNKWDTDYGV